MLYFKVLPIQYLKSSWIFEFQMDTKTFMSKDDYGNSLSIGFSSLMKKLIFLMEMGLKLFFVEYCKVCYQMKLYDGSEKDILMHLKLLKRCIKFIGLIMLNMD